MGNTKFNGNSQKKFSRNFDSYKGRDTRDNYKKMNRDTDNEEINEGLVIGRNAVRELLKSGRTIDKLLVQKGDLFQQNFRIILLHDPDPA